MKVFQRPDDKDEGESDQGMLKGYCESQTPNRTESLFEAWEYAFTSQPHLLGLFCLLHTTTVARRRSMKKAPDPRDECKALMYFTYKC